MQILPTDSERVATLVTEFQLFKAVSHLNNLNGVLKDMALIGLNENRSARFDRH